MNEYINEIASQTTTITPYLLEMIASVLRDESDRVHKEMTMTVPRIFIRGCLEVVEKIPLDENGEVAYCLDRLKYALKVK